MSWKKLAQKDRDKALAFLLKNEYLTVNASSLLLHRPFLLSGYPAVQTYGWQPQLVRGLEALMVIRGKSLFIPILSAPDLPLAEARSAQGLWDQAIRASELIPVIRAKSATYFNLMGPTRWVEPVEKNLDMAPYQRITYDLMILEQPPVPPTLPSGIEIRRLGEADRDTFFPLQEAYEKEEVLFSPLDFNPPASRQHFSQQLEREMIFGLTIDGRPIAKAGSNALGKRVAQIGGVFCSKNERSRGYAKLLMEVLLNRLAPQYAASLFVKKTNPSAQALYRRLGFTVVEDFVLSYFRKP